MSADARFTPQGGGASYGGRSADREAYFGRGTVHHFSECWEHNDSPTYSNMVRATRDLIDCRAVCDDPEHQQDALAEWLDIAEQNAAISRKD